MTKGNNIRQVKYNMITDTADRLRLRHQWTFLILNTAGEINRIQGRILEQLATCDNLTKLDSGILVPKESLMGRLIYFDCEQGKIEDKDAIYKSRKFYKDRNLYPMDDVQFARYTEQFQVR